MRGHGQRPNFSLKQRIAGVVDIDDYDPGVGCLVPGCPTRPDVRRAVLQPFPDATERKTQGQQRRSANARIDSPSKRALGASLVVHVRRERTSFRVQAMLDFRSSRETNADRFFSLNCTGAGTAELVDHSLDRIEAGFVTTQEDSFCSEDAVSYNRFIPTQFEVCGMPQEEKFDLVIVGCGPAGEKAGAQAAYFGKRVAVIERAGVPGGSCINTGTVPSKTLRESALYFSGLGQRGLYGIDYSLKDNLTVHDFYAPRAGSRGDGAQSNSQKSGTAQNRIRARSSV